MRRLTSIVAMNHERAIGVANRLPWRLPTDMALFRAATIGNVVLMGRKTFESIGRPLSGRTNVVLSRDSLSLAPAANVRIVRDPGMALAAATAAVGREGEGYVIGGASIYGLFAGLVDRCLVTLVDKDVPDADTFFDTDLFGDDDWEVAQHASVAAGPGVDESDFTIFELTHRRPGEPAMRRAALLAATRAASGEQ